MVLDKQYLFIVGSPRSGTTWLQLMLGAHPAVCTSVELTTFIYTNRWIYLWNRQSEDIREDRWHIGLPMVWTEEEFYGFLREFLERIYSRVWSTNPEVTHILDKHPAHAAFVEEINTLIPGSRFIHAIRDGRDVAASMVAAKQQMGFGTGTVTESAAAWKEHVEWGKKARQFDGRYLEVRYEMMLEDPINTLKTVYQFCDLQTTEEQVAQIVEKHAFDKLKADRVSPVEGVALPQNFYRKGKAGSWRSDIAPVQRYLFDQVAGDLLVELGYAEEGWWAETSLQKYLLPLQAAFSTRQRFRQTVKKSARRILKPATQSA
jgi:hypothetical protein